MAWPQIDDLLEDTAQRFTESQLGVKMSRRQFRRYCKALADDAEREEVERAVTLLTGRGFKVSAPRKKR